MEMETTEMVTQDSQFHQLLRPNMAHHQMETETDIQDSQFHPHLHLSMVHQLPMVTTDILKDNKLLQLSTVHHQTEMETTETDTQDNQFHQLLRHNMAHLLQMETEMDILKGNKPLQVSMVPLQMATETQMDMQDNKPQQLMAMDIQMATEQLVHLPSMVLLQMETMAMDIQMETTVTHQLLQLLLPRNTVLLLMAFLVNINNDLIKLFLIYCLVSATSGISSFGPGSVETTNSVYASNGGYSSGAPSAVPDTIQQSYDAQGGYQY
jgi:hypothetical protein